MNVTIDFQSLKTVTSKSLFKNPSPLKPGFRSLWLFAPNVSVCKSLKITQRGCLHNKSKGWTFDLKYWYRLFIWTVFSSLSTHLSRLSTQLDFFIEDLLFIKWKKNWHVWIQSPSLLLFYRYFISFTWETMKMAYSVDSDGWKDCWKKEKQKSLKSKNETKFRCRWSSTDNSLLKSSHKYT